jgi:hypothetical protein
LYGEETDRGKHIMRVVKYKIMREVVSLRRDEAMKGRGELLYKEIHNLYPSCDTVGMTKSRLITWIKWRDLKVHA